MAGSMGALPGGGEVPGGRGGGAAVGRGLGECAGCFLMPKGWRWRQCLASLSCKLDKWPGLGPTLTHDGLGGRAGW